MTVNEKMFLNHKYVFHTGFSPQGDPNLDRLREPNPPVRPIINKLLGPQETNTIPF